MLRGAGQPLSLSVGLKEEPAVHNIIMQGTLSPPQQARYSICQPRKDRKLESTLYQLPEPGGNKLMS